ncbi:hypothetical protein BDV28DRAFT_148108 [Aspergillus coremiiformis]|uniref:Zn(2)-C6 fungal-type domain-containing protein n=1 Tax=Aspergillus coremiiformis TaxID=138285 RepID=A0A5N6ZBD6_9EURO|nr:hypothetical protein BDV28DRAFT_148108 [Aspergillus coremiiformis]
MSSDRQAVTKRACDGCKIRKIRCGGGQPCRSCIKTGIKCTYVRVQQCRGPRRLRSTTQFLIEQVQYNGDSYNCEASHQSGEAVQLNPNPGPVRKTTDRESARIPLETLTSPLSIYHVRMYPVWPVVNVEQVVSALQSDVDRNDNETYALATAVAAATIAQLRLGDNSDAGEVITAERLASECLRARDICHYRSKPNLNMIRASFFLHVYYENQNPGGSESLLYLREAIATAQMLGLHRESSYRSLSSDERQLRRRVLWLLFVTERGVCILHRFPVTLKTNISAPQIDEHDEPQVLRAFVKLLGLFQIFEKSGMFDIIQDEHSDLLPDANQVSLVDAPFLESLQRNLQDGSLLFEHISDVQKADLCVTRHWMRMVLWKLSPKKSLASSPSADRSMSLYFPIMVAKELVGIVSQLPRSAIEAHGLGMELKIYEVANSLADAITNLTVLPRIQEWELEGDSRPNYLLSRLHSILSTFRGGANKKLVDVLYRKMADAQLIIGPALTTSVQRSRRGTKKRRIYSQECETRANDQPTSKMPELINHDSISVLYPQNVDPLVYPFNANDLAYASVCDLAFETADNTRYPGASDFFQSTYDGATPQFLFDPSSLAIASEDVATLSPLLSSFMPINTISEDLSSQALRASTQDLFFPGTEFPSLAANGDFAGLY